MGEINLEDILKTAVSINTFPQEVVVIGCEPKDTSDGFGISQEVTNSIDNIIDLIYKEISFTVKNTDHA